MNGTIEVKGVHGDISATLIAGDRVTVTAVKEWRRSDPDEVEIDVVEHAGGVTICAVYPSRRDRMNECREGRQGHMNVRRNDVRVHFTVHVPAGVALVARTVNGEVEARDLRSEVTASTVNGDIRLRTTGGATAHTVNGSIDAAMASLQDDASFETVNGSITLEVPEPFDADLEAATVNGRIDTDLPVTMRGGMTRHRIRGTLGAGGFALALKTVNGSIRLRRL